MKILKYNEMKRYNNIDNIYEYNSPYGTVRQLIEYLQQMNPDANVIINIGTDAKEITSIEDMTVEQADEYYDGIIEFTNWPPNNDIVVLGADD